MAIKVAQKPQPITFESVKSDALEAVHESLQTLRKILMTEEPKLQIAAALALVKILDTTADLGVVEGLPLLKELQELAKKKAA